jgi:hypothetical protein
MTQKRLPKVRRRVAPRVGAASSGTSSASPPALPGALDGPTGPADPAPPGAPSEVRIQGDVAPGSIAIGAGASEAAVGPPQWTQRFVSTGKLTSQRGQRTS